jgi:hypothetical protein
MEKLFGWVRYWTIVILMALAWTVSADMMPPPEPGEEWRRYTVCIVKQQGGDTVLEVMTDPMPYEDAKTLYNHVIGDGNAYQMMEVLRWAHKNVKAPE